MLGSYWNIEALTGYKPKTTFWEDFSIAEHFGINAIKDTYKTAFKNWKTDVIYLTELVMVLNWKIWQWYEISEEVGRLYDKLWRETQDYASKHLKGDDLNYFYRTID